MKRHVYGLTIDSKSGQAIAAISTPTEIGDLYLLSLNGEGTLERLTEVNDIQDVVLSKPEPIEYEGANGRKIHGWLMKPVDFETGKNTLYYLRFMAVRMRCMEILT